MIDLTAIKAHYRETADNGDRWGSAMGAFFDVAEILYLEADGEVPDEWQYRPSPLLREVSDENKYSGYDHEELAAFGHLLSRYTSILDGKGLSY